MFRIDSSGTLTTLHDLSGTSAGRVDSGRRRAPVRADGRRWPRWRLARSSRWSCKGRSPRFTIQSRSGRWKTERRDPGTQRPVLWDHQACSLPLSQRGRQGLCSRWMPRAHARHCTRSSGPPVGQRRWHTDVEPVRRRRRKPVRNHVQRARLGPFRPGQIFRISPAGRLHDACLQATRLQAGVIQARDGRLYGTSAAASDAPDAQLLRECLQSRSEWHAHGSP